MWKIKCGKRIDLNWTAIVWTICVSIIVGIADVQSQSCASVDIPSFSTHTERVDPGEANIVIAVFRMINTNSLQSKTEIVDEKYNQHNYIEAIYNAENELIITTTLNFPNYEFNERVTEFVIELQLVCSDGINRVFYLDIVLNEKNNHDPEFTQSQYEIILPLPLPRDFEITLLSPISATDNDLINNAITYSATSSSFKFETVTTEDRREFFAHLITAHQLLRIEDAIVFEITATDAGTPQRSTTAQITITTNEESFLIEAPEFVQKIYKESLSDDLKLIDVNDIKITEATYSDAVTVTLQEDGTDLFKIVQAGNSFKLELNNDLTEGDVNGITSFELLLKASVPDGDDGFTVIIISTPPVPDAPQFTKSLYTTSLDLELKLPTFDDIQLTDNELLKNVQITLEGDDSDLFKYDIGETSILIELEDDLTEQIVENKHVLQFEIVAILKENLIGRTAVVINIPTAECDILPKVFPSELYIGTITTDFEININPIELLSSSPANIRIVPSDFDENFFEVQLVSNQIIISKGEGWDETIIRDKLSLRFVIYAYDEELIVDKAVVVFEIQKEECPISITIFEEEFFTGFIDEHLEFTAPTIPVPESINPEIQFTLEKFDAALFVINKENNQLQINIKPELLYEEYIADKINLHFIIVAKLGDDVVDSTNCIVEITPAECKALPNIFSKSVFKGVLNSNLELVLDTIPLGIDATSDISYSLAEDDAELFQIDGNTLEGVKITLKDDLQPGDIDQKTNLHFVLAARDDNEKLVDRTVVVIDLPRDLCRQVPVFVKPLYNGLITTTLDDIDVEVIQLTPASNREGVSMILDTEFDSALFNLMPLENDEITLKLKDKLTEAQIENKKVLQVTILAVLDGAIIGTSSVVFEIPKAACSSGSKIFKTSIHKGAFTSDLNLQPLSVEYNEDPEIDFVIALEESHDYALFTLSYENGEISIALAELINPDTISDRSNIEIVIIATVEADTIDSIVVVIDIPKEICKQVPIFEEPLHIGQVTDDLDDIIIGKISLAPSSNLDNVEFYLQSDDQDLFKDLSYEDDEIKIKFKETLLEDQIRDKLYLWLTIFAEMDGVVIGSTVVALALPIKEIEGPHSINVFEKQLYRGQLLDDLITVDVETITLNDLEGLVLQYELEEWDHELFEIEEDDGLDIKLSRQLNEAEIDGKVTLQFVIVANIDLEIVSKSAVVIELPQNDCPGITTPGPTNTPPTDAPTSPTCSPIDCDCEDNNTAFVVIISLLAVALVACAIGTFVMWWYRIRPYAFLRRNSDFTGSVTSNEYLANDFSKIGTSSQPTNTSAALENEIEKQLYNDSKPTQQESPTLMGRKPSENISGDSTSNDFTEPNAPRVKFDEQVIRIDILDNTLDNDKVNV